MSQAPRIVVRDGASELDRAAILRALITHNEKAGGPSGFQQVCLVVEDPDTGETTGGLWGRIIYDWLFVEFLAVPETARRSGLGTELLNRAEQIAKDRGCAGVWLDTYQFQAPDFYRKHGYQEFGRIADHPRGSQRLFFMKTF